MNKEPFVINITDEDLPNLALDKGDMLGLEYSKTNLWQDDNSDILRLINSINEKLDIVVKLMKESGKD